MANRSTLFERAGRSDRLTSIDRPGIDHVLCATDLQSGEQVYLSGRFVYGYRFGKGLPGDLRLSTAVRASANLPFAFPAMWLRTKRFAFRYPKDDVPVGSRGPDWKDCPEARHRPANRAYLLLTDGGVYDNMADQWPQGFRGRVACWPTLPDEHHECDVLVVANASEGLTWRPMKRTRIPGLGGVLSLLGVKDVLYDQTTAQRRAGLVGRFDRSELQRRAGRRPGICRDRQHPAEPPRRPRSLSGQHVWPDRAERAAAVLAALERTSDDWEEIARANAQVPTMLSALGDAVASRLIRHGSFSRWQTSTRSWTSRSYQYPLISTFASWSSSRGRPRPPAFTFGDSCRHHKCVTLGDDCSTGIEETLLQSNCEWLHEEPVAEAPRRGDR